MGAIYSFGQLEDNPLAVYSHLVSNVVTVEYVKDLFGENRPRRYDR